MKRELRKALTQAFRVARAGGYFASHNFASDSWASWAMIPWVQSFHVIFYHDQDKADADLSGFVYLTWQGDPVYLRAVLESEGLVVHHDGSLDTRIGVTLP